MKSKIKDWKKLDPDYAKELEKHPEPAPSRVYILQVLAEQPGPTTAKELFKALQLSKSDPLEALERRLNAMVRDGQIVCNRRGAFGLLPKMQVARGRVQGHRDGFGFLIRDDQGGADVFLSPRQMRQLMPGDRALVRISGNDNRGRPEGSLVEVLERSQLKVVGRFHEQQGACHVSPDNPRMTHDILIPPDATGGASEGQMVVAEITKGPALRSLPVGKVCEVLGEHLAPGMEIEAAIRAHGIPHEWPDAVNAAVEELPETVRPEDLPGRMDVRGLPLVTIDGEDARDFDDAIHAQPRAQGGWTVWVAIADVSAYVTPGSALDLEAARRGTSVYFPERVVPMLPEALSNGLCSLNPHVDRLCMVCEMQLGTNGKVSTSRFYPGVMHSRARLTYTEVFEALESADSAAAQQHAELMPHLRALDAVFAALHAERSRRGALDLDSTETRVVFGPDRKIERMVLVQRNRAHRIVEECMIAANVEAARHLSAAKLPTPLRIHENPDPTKVEALRGMLAERGLKLGGAGEPTPADFASLLQRVREREDSRPIQSLVLRTMMQARYSTEARGHFGLALEHYGHFTSPIRRYPDLLLHRALRHMLSGQSPDAFAYDFPTMEAHCAHCSTVERRADEAVRDVLAWLKCEFMRNCIGEEYDGVVTSVLNFGLFIQLESVWVEGLVHVSSLPNDYYVFDAKRHQLNGERGGHRYAMGQKVRVRVVRVDLDERKIDLEIAGTTPGTGKAKAAPKRKSGPRGGKPRGRPGSKKKGRRR